MSLLLSELRAAIGRENVVSAPSELAVYDCDAFTIERDRPLAVVFPRSTEQVVQTVKLCRQRGVSLVARGAGTSLAGGCLPQGGIVLMLTRMNAILDIDLRNRMAVVEAGVTNLRLGQALTQTGFHYAPDPSSQGASTIGGNIATNAGGPHTLKYGVTVNHVLGIEAVLSDGSILQLGPVEAPDGFDLVGLLVGSEGTLGIVTKAWVRLTPNPQDYRTMRATFDSLDDASNTVSQIVAAGIIPAALELMDQGILTAVEDAYHVGFPADAGAVLVIEVDGPAVGLDRQQEQIVAFCRRLGAREILQAASAQERELLWKCRKMAVGATGRLSPSYTIQDGVVPRTQLPHIMRRTAEIGRKHRIRIVNVAHAGDGNVHPILLFDERDRNEVERAVAAGREILQECIACGGSITAEHGIGVEKIALMDQLFMPADLEAMRRVRQAFDPTGLLNPGKLIPQSQGNDSPSPKQTDGCAAPQETAPVPGDKVIDYPMADMTITVEAGITVKELNRQLAVNRQWLPVDVPHQERTTVGEAIAMNAAGPRRYAYGAMRDYVLGFTAVDGRGTVFGGGGRVVKNAAGYNMCRLMAGSRGALGTVLQATLMVRPMPEASALLACEFGDFDLAERLLASLARLPICPVAVELLAGRSHQGNPLFGPVLDQNAGRLHVGFEGSEAEVAWMLNRLREEWTAVGMNSPVLMPHLATNVFWQWMASLPTDARIHVLPSRTLETVEKLSSAAPDAAIHAHAGDGLIRVHCAQGKETSEDDAEGRNLVSRLQAIADAAGGKMAMEQIVRDAAFVSGSGDGPLPPELRVMRAIRERFIAHPQT